MKYCSKCGNAMDDEMLFCQKCGTKAPEQAKYVEEDTYSSYLHETPITTSPYSPEIPQTKPRKGMKVWSVVCFVFAAIYTLMAFAFIEIIGMALFCAVFGIMFSVLSKSPKELPNIMGKESGMSKSTFVLLSIGLAFGVFIAAMSSSMETIPQTETNVAVTADDSKTSSEIKTMADVQKQYENRMPAIGQSLNEYAQTVSGLTNMNVTESKFLLGEDLGWYNCHYTFYFKCSVNGEPCTGEARAFTKIDSNEIVWFHFEIFKDSDWSTVVELYDEAYDGIIEAYYKELAETYN